MLQSVTREDRSEPLANEFSSQACCSLSTDTMRSVLTLACHGSFAAHRGSEYRHLLVVVMSILGLL